MSDSDVVIRVEGLGKKYSLHHEQSERYTALRDVVARQAKAAGRLLNPFTLAGQLRKAQRQAAQERSESEEDFWALKDVSFEIRRGERVGIIGRNGAGKSTLLKILSRITEPTTGRVEIRGRVASLLEVGTGFHPELTGRENIYLNGAILGMTRREIRSKFDEIVDFAEVEKFLDTPVKRYSSGMYVRLAFAVAAHLEPEILVVDEVLAVGDANFQKKCLGKMKNSSTEDGKTVLFVSHNVQALLELTERCVVLDKGQVSTDTHTRDAIDKYIGGSSTRPSSYLIEESHRPKGKTATKAEIIAAYFDKPTPCFDPAEPLEFCIDVKLLDRSVRRIRTSFTIFSARHGSIGSGFTKELEIPQADALSFTHIITIGNHQLSPGNYYVGLAIGEGNHKTGHKDYDIALDILYFTILENITDVKTAVLSRWEPGWGAIRFSDVSSTNQTIRK
jgi:lipopolysaccharide transport system ATP-binding protein